jgi:multicomponent K+:H+ antiporter subunit C
MEALVASAIAILTASGVYLLLRARTFPVVLGLTLLSYAVNLFIFVMGRLQAGVPPKIVAADTAYADPLPQALVLTAIVIGFGMTAFLIVLALRARIAVESDHVDGSLAEERITADALRRRRVRRPAGLSGTAAAAAAGTQRRSPMPEAEPRKRAR